jgi:predicted aldo/keto reductase-like oxidoreductase
MKEHRKDFFLATKTGERTYQAARDQIRRSLERLQVEQVDLIQLHNLTDPAEWEVALGPGGALEAAIEARDEGLVRFIGVTGHGLRVAELHKKALEKFAFDSVLLPFDFPMMQNPQYAADFARPRYAARLEIATSRPCLRSTISGSTAATLFTAPSTLIPITFAACSGVSLTA